jgi:hypothetical protein
MTALNITINIKPYVYAGFHFVLEMAIYSLGLLFQLLEV